MDNIIIEPGEKIEYGGTPRYRVIRPVPHGEAYWEVHDTREPNLPHASIPKGFHDAEGLAVRMVRALNAEAADAVERAKPDPRIYPCRECGCMRNIAEGGTTFTVCEDCWDREAKKGPGNVG